jgi:hypothetical protein
MWVPAWGCGVIIHPSVEFKRAGARREKRERTLRKITKSLRNDEKEVLGRKILDLKKQKQTNWLFFMSDSL